MTFVRSLSAMLLLGAVLSSPRPVAAGDWTQFRGPDGSGLSNETGLPIRWSATENIRWKAPLPGRGLSCPVVAGGKVYVTACTGYLQDRLHVLCFSADSGQKLWERQIWATGMTVCHPKTCMAAPTPVTDGKRVYALFATADLACLDADGNLLWYRALAKDYPQIANQVGMAASPILWQDVLLVPMENSLESFIAGIDILTGKNRWKVDRPKDINWTTPIVVRGPQRAMALFMSPKGLGAYDPSTGQKLWDYDGPGLNSIPSLAAGLGKLVLPNGVVLKIGSAATVPETAWKTTKMKPGYATPLCLGDRVYSLNGQGVLACFDLQDGKELWQERVSGPFAASPVVADGKMYLVNEEGATSVVQLSDPPKVLATNPLGENIMATPAIADGAIFLRSDQHLYCISERKKK